MLCLAQVALTPLACASFSIPMICSSLNLLFISFCSFYLSRTTLFNCPVLGDQANAKSSFLPKNCRKLLYQRTTGSSKRITMCSTTIHANADAIDQFRPRTNHLLREHRLFNQMLGSSSRINNRNIL